MDLSFRAENSYFCYRVGAIIIHKNRLLMATNPNVDFYYTIGGRVAFGESSVEALHREIKEELGICLEIDHLAFVNEYFYRIGKEKIPAHEIGLYYSMKDDAALNSLPSHFEDGIYDNTLRWIPLDELERQHIYPEFLATLLPLKDKQIQHIISCFNEQYVCKE